MKIIRIGLDLAKNVFSVYGVDAHKGVVLHRTLRCDRCISSSLNLSHASWARRRWGTQVSLAMRPALPPR
jgi:hypothetical protein